MREILFRGKDVYGKWLYGDLINLTDEIKQICNHTQLEHAHSVNPETVGQFTGLTDRNGKRIFEGDIVTGLFLFGRSVKAVVTFQDGAFGLEWYRGNVKTFNAFTSICNVEYEVVGNIHDNPELLKND